MGIIAAWNCVERNGIVVPGIEMTSTIAKQNLCTGVRVPIQTNDSSGRAMALKARRKGGLLCLGCKSAAFGYSRISRDGQV